MNKVGLCGFHIAVVHIQLPIYKNLYDREEASADSEILPRKSRRLKIFFFRNGKVIMSVNGEMSKGDAEMVKSIVANYLISSGSSIAEEFIKEHNVKPLPKEVPSLEVLVKETYIPCMLVRSANKISMKK